MFRANDTIYVIFSDTVYVGHRLTQEQADQLNAGEVPKWAERGRIERTDDTIHFFPGGSGGCSENPDEKGKLSWSFRDTTCRCCIEKRAYELRGWRWDAPFNAEDVAYITEVLGEDEAAKYASMPAKDLPIC